MMQTLIDTLLGLFLLCFMCVTLAAAILMGVMNTKGNKRKKRDRKNRYEIDQKYNDPDNWL